MSENDHSLFHNFNFSVVFNDKQDLALHVQDVQLPSMAIGVTEQHGKYGKSNVLAGTSFVYEPLRFNWLLDENLDTYFYFVNWLKTLANPRKVESFDFFSDISVIIYNNNGLKLKTVNFEKCFPISLSEVLLSSKSRIDDSRVAMSVSFEFEDMLPGDKYTNHE